MFLGHTNPKLWVSVKAIVLYLCKFTEPRKKQLKVEILHAYKRILKRIFKFYWVLKEVKLKISFIFKKYYSYEKIRTKISICMKKFYFLIILLKTGFVANVK